ncbi:hypothetical protein [Caudoviricetes sp.]|nr:hypothetical protein [Caudoviricetes sp.]UOF79159.1 hypothetical protein [Caudoviricetes sp.]
MSNDKKSNDLKGKTKFQATDYGDFDDENDIDDVLKKELAEKNLEYRFIDYKQAKLNGGRNRNGWMVYKRDTEDPRLSGIASLKDPDGMVRQGSMVLAVKTKNSAEKQRNKIRHQTRSLNDYNKATAEELDQKARQLGGSRIVAGYDKNS